MTAGTHTYADAGVSLAAADAVVDRLRGAVASTRTAGVIDAHGGFAGLFAMAGHRDPVLVAGTDGVGTKIVLLRALDRLAVAGVDCVAMCVNDVVCTGARPAFFLDYVSCGQLQPERVATLVEGIARGCREAGCALLGGETAEHPGVQAPDEIDVAGFCVGVVERDALIDGRRVEAGDAIVGLASTGPHANGFSLVRRLLEQAGIDGADAPAALLAPTAIYARAVAALTSACDVRAFAHVTGGGIAGNLRRVLPSDLGATIDPARWPRPAVFDWLAGLGVEEEELRRVFNCGLGMLAVVGASEAPAAIAAVPGDLDAWHVGTVVHGGGVRFEP